ncbi:hypothetical protein C8Q76DRAFT_792380 [Earliella scabrosa]|nr:hypothetical protein C8Q76DRAFT_792380 [Earliella scabrosa]
MSQAELAETVKEVLLRLQTSEDLDDSTVQICHDRLTEALSILRQKMNARQPLFRLPLEVLQKVLSEVADQPEFIEPFWSSTAQDATALRSILHTCRYLRELALSHRLLWRTIITHGTFAPTTMVTWSGDAPLNVVIWPYADMRAILDDCYRSLVHRVQELHVVDIGHRHINYLQALLELEHPALLSYSISGKPGDLTKWPTYTLPLSKTAAGTLQDLHVRGVPLLPAVQLPFLTHIALCDITHPHLGDAIVDVLGRCPNLQAVVLSNLGSVESNRHTLSATSTVLRRVTIRGRFYSLYDRLFPYRGDSDVSSVQFLLPPSTLEWRLPGDIPRFLEHVRSSATLLRVCLRGGRSHHDVFASEVLVNLSMTAVGPNGVTHIVQTFLGLPAPYVYDAYKESNYMEQLRLPACLGLREVWVQRSSVTHHAEDQPSLDACPSKSQWSPSFHRPTTLILVFQGPPASAYVLETIRFEEMLQALRSGEYDYFEHLVVRTMSQFVPMEEALEELRKHFATVRVEKISAVQELPLPASAIETRAGSYGGRKLWKDALW